MAPLRALIGLFVVLSLASDAAFAQEWSVDRPRGSAAIIERYEEVLADDPTSTHALEGLIREYAGRGGLEALVERWAQRVAERPVEVVAHLVLARLREQGGQYAAALALADRAVALGADDPEVFALRGRLHGELGASAAAVADYERALEGTREREARIALLRELGDLHLALGQRERAVDAYERIAAEAPRDRWVRMELANILYEAGLREAALEELRAVVELARTDTRERADALRETAVLEEELERWDEAIVTWQRVRDLTQPSSWLHQTAEDGLVRVYRASGRLPELLATIDAELTARSRDRWTLATRARVLGELGRFDECVEAYRLALERLGGARDLTLELASLLGRAGRVDEAQELVQAHLVRHPDDFEALSALAELLVDADRVFDASFVLRTFEEQHWNGTSELWALFALYQRTGDQRAGDRVAGRILELSPGDLRPLLRMAERSLEEGNIEEGLATLARVTESDDPVLHLDSVDILERNGQPAEAERLVRAARARFPDDDTIASRWLQAVRTDGAETALAAARDVVLRVDRWDVVVDAFALYWTLLAEARLTDWAIGHYQAAFDQAPLDYRTGRLVLLLRIVEGDVSGASETLSALRVAAPTPEQPEEWVLATLRRWPRPEALPLLRRLSSEENGGSWRFRVLEARALGEAGRDEEARELLAMLAQETGDRAAALFAVGEAFGELAEPRDEERGCAMMLEAAALEPRDDGYRLAAIDCLTRLDKALAAYELVMAGLGMVREVGVADALWERLLWARPAGVTNAELAERLRAALETRSGVLRTWLDTRLRELGAGITGP